MKQYVSMVTTNLSDQNCAVDCSDTPVLQPHKLLSLKFLGYHDIFTLGENVRGETDLVQLEGGYR